MMFADVPPSLPPPQAVLIAQAAPDVRPKPPTTSTPKTATQETQEAKEAKELIWFEALFNDPSEEERAILLATVLEKKLKLSDAQINKLIRDSSSNIRFGLTGYTYLNQAQVKALIKAIIATNDANLIEASIQNLLRNEGILLDAADIALFTNSKLSNVRRAVVMSSRVVLDATTIQTYAQSDDVLLRLYVASRYKVGDKGALLTQIVNASNPNDIRIALLLFDPIPDDIVTLMLAHPNPLVRENFSLAARFKPKPAQIEQGMNDSASGVRIGFLRRKDITITAEQLNNSLNNPDKNVVFWVLTHKYFYPTPEQYEAGLTSLQLTTRRHYAYDDKTPTTAAQIERGLTDSDDGVRTAFMRRKNITLTDAQLDRCITDQIFFVRDTCVKRDDFRMTQTRFETLLVDKNPNILGNFNRDRTTKEGVVIKAFNFDQFIWHTIRNANALTKIALAENRGISFTEAQISEAMNTPDAAVKTAFMRRQNRLKSW